MPENKTTQVSTLPVTQVQPSLLGLRIPPCHGYSKLKKKKLQISPKQRSASNATALLLSCADRRTRNFAKTLQDILLLAAARELTVCPKFNF